MLVAALAGCSGSSDAASDGKGSGSGGGSDALTITEPSDGANVQVPFTVKYTSNVEIGPTDSGKDHVHFIVDGKTNEYVVVTSTTYQIKDLTPGKHTVAVTLQHADHSPVGPSKQITVNVTGAGGSGGSGGSGDSGGGGYDYGSGGNGY
jgi:hypothetical protein